MESSKKDNYHLFLPELLIPIKQEWAKSKASITKQSKRSIGAQRNYTYFSLSFSFSKMAQPTLMSSTFCILESLRTPTQLETRCTSFQQPQKNADSYQWSVCSGRCQDYKICNFTGKSIPT